MARVVSGVAGVIEDFAGAVSEESECAVLKSGIGRK